MFTTNTDGYARVTVVDGTVRTGLYAADGSINIVERTGDAFIGLYHPCGAINIIVVDGTTRTGLYHSSGALNVIVGEQPGKIYHSSGALQIDTEIGPVGFNPATLPGIIGVYDVSVLSSMTTGLSGSGGTPGIGDPVGTLADLSPAGNDLVAPSGAARPVLRQTVGGLYYLEHDGVDDRMSSGTIATVDAPIYIAAALEKGIEDARRMPAVIQDNFNWIGGQNVTTLGRMQGLLRTTALSVRVTTHGVGTFPVNTPTVTEVLGDGTNLVTQLNGGDERTVAADPFGGFTNAIITTTENSIQMNFYGGVFRAGTANSGTDAADIRTWLAEKSGATLV